MLLRIAIALFFTTLGVLATTERLGIGIPIPLEEAIRRQLNQDATPEELDARAIAALERGDVSEARSFADLASDLGRPLPPATIERLETAEGPFHTAMRNAGDFATGFATGAGEGPAGLAGSVISDFTVVGDVRDLSREGARWIAGEPYSQLLLGLSAVGIAATAATVATGGGGAPVKVSVSLLKAAFRIGAITAGLSRDLGRIVARSVDFGRLGAVLRATDLGSVRSLRDSAGAIRGSVRTEAFAGVAADLGAVQARLGAADTVRLLRHVHSAQDLADAPSFVARFGTKSRAVASFTGRASLRAFRTTVRVFDWILEAIVAVFFWFAGLLAGMLLSLGRRLLVWLVARTSHRRRQRPVPRPAAHSAPLARRPDRPLMDALRRVQALRQA